LSSNSQSYFLGDLVEFSVIGNDGIDLTDQSTISIVGDSDLSSNIYATSAEGMFSFVATYQDFTSAVYDINVLPAPTRFNQNVLIEDYTGTWCGYCPRVSHAIDLVNQQTSEAVVVAIHRGSTDPNNSSYDPYNFSAGSLEDLINLQGYPTAMLNRTTEWNYPEPNNVNQVIDLTSEPADVGLAISPSLDGFEMSIDVNVKFGGQFSDSEAKLVLYVLEDGLLFDQSNSTSYYGGSTVISNFEHNHVLRASLSNLMGDQIPATEYSEDNVYELNYTSAIPSNISVNENMTLVAFVTNEYNAALNVRVANFGETQIFEEL
jgi:thiol-disulfide isomerase/thioredoxin